MAFSYKEWKVLDIIKFICIVLFMYGHFVFLTIASPTLSIAKTEGLLFVLTKAFRFLGQFAYFMPLLTGCILRAGIGKVKNQNPNLKIRNIVFNGIILIVIGFLMNMITFGIMKAFSWNILQTIAVSCLLTVIIFKLFGEIGLILASFLILLFSSYIAQLFSQYNSYYFVGIFIGNTTKFIFWPILPWASFVFIGFLLAHYYIKSKNSTYYKYSVFSISVICILIAFLRGEVIQPIYKDFVFAPFIIQPALGYLLIAIGLFCILLLLLNEFEENIKLRKYGIINSFSKGILWIYIVQMILIYKMRTISWRIIPGFSEKVTSNVIVMKYLILYCGLFIMVLLVSWLVGYLCIRFLQEKRFIIILRKVQK